LLLAGVAVGVLFSLRMDWVTPASSSTPVANAPVASPAVVAASQGGFVGVVKAAMPAVVNISTTRVVRAKDMQQMSPFFNDPFFRQFFGDQNPHGFRMPRDRRENSLGSGVIVDPSGYIVTNNHVVDKADEIKVLLGDKREFVGKVVGTDPKTDIAVIKINAKDLPFLPWGESDNLQVGEYVLAMGNPFGLNQTVTLGIVSAVGRANVGIADYEDFIQTDAAINPGNSGGALVNARGELVGINTAIFSRSGGYMGVGFAVPSKMAHRVMQSLIDKGKVVRGWLGVSIQELSPELVKSFGLADAKGALVGEVVPSSPAEKAGLKIGDVILSVDGKTVGDPSALRNLVADIPVGKEVRVGIVRDKKTRDVTVKIAEQPANLTRTGETPDEEGGTSGGAGLAGMEVQELTAEVAQQLDLPKGTTGVVVSEVDPASTAAEAGVRRGDVIAEINRVPVRNVRDYTKVVNKLGKNDSVLLLIARGNGKLFVAIKQ
jgi:serine protease Do